MRKAADALAQEGNAIKTVALELSLGEPKLCTESVMLAVIKHLHRMSCNCLLFDDTAFASLQCIKLHALASTKSPVPQADQNASCSNGQFSKGHKNAYDEPHRSCFSYRC